MSQPVSVAMAVYNGLPYLAAQLESVLAELQPDDELVVVDDHSTDGSLTLLQDLTDDRLVLLTNDRNVGVRLSFERALRACTKHVILLCDQDDVWMAGKREAMVRPFEEDPQCAASVSDAEVIDGQGALLSRSFMADRGGFRGGWWATLIKNRYLGCCMALRLDVIALGLPIPAKAPMHDMWFGMLAAHCGRVHYVARAYLQYRRHGNNASPSRRAGIAQMLSWRWNLLAQVTLRVRGRSTVGDGAPESEKLQAGRRGK